MKHIKLVSGNNLATVQHKFLQIAIYSLGFGTPFFLVPKNILQQHPNPKGINLLWVDMGSPIQHQILLLAWPPQLLSKHRSTFIQFHLLFISPYRRAQTNMTCTLLCLHITPTHQILNQTKCEMGHFSWWAVNNTSLH